MIEQAVFSGWMSILEEHYSKSFGKAILGFYYQEFSTVLTTEQFVDACRAVMRNEKFSPPLQVFIDYGKPDALSSRPEYQQFIAPAQESPEELKANRAKLSKMVAAIGRVMPEVADEADANGIDSGLRVRCDRLSSAIVTADHLILRNEAILKAIDFVQSHPDVVELITAHDGSIHGVRPKTATVRRLHAN